ncbi:MAG TPA: hypothetical protein VM120_05475 [Bryobacteraceae bacterium]|nr:hypothetical protein [Bryobacteraceae bacterium]
MRGRRWLGTWFVLFLAPLVLTSFTRPFGWWDYLTTLAHGTSDAQELGFQVSGVWLKFDYTAPGALARNYIHNLTENDYVLRPTLSLIYHLQGLAFGGEFWLWYVVKWASLFGIVWIAMRILGKLGAPEGACWAAAALVLFHPCSFDLMLCNADSWVAVGIVCALGLLILQPRFTDVPFDVTSLSAARYGALLAVWYLTLGVKESALAWALSLACILQFSSWRKAGSWPRLAPFYVLIAFWVWRLAVISKVRLAGHGVEDYPRKLWQLIRYLAPDSPLHAAGVLLAVLLGWGLVHTLRRQPVGLQRLWLLSGAAAAGILLMSARFHAAPRCNIPVVHLLGLLAGLSLAMLAQRWPWRGWRLAWPVMAVCMPFFNSANLYNQALAFQQLFLDFADALRVIEDKVAAGYQLAFTGQEEMGLETQVAVALYFRRFGPRFYELPSRPRKIYVIGRDGMPPEPFVLLTGYTPLELLEGKLAALNSENIEAIEFIERGRYGAVEKLAAFYTKWNCRMANCGPPSYDIGAPVVSAAPPFHIVTVGKPAARSLAVEAAGTLCGAPDAAGECYFQVPKGEPLVRRTPLGSWKGWVRLEVEGQIQVTQGPVAFGITNRQGRDLWNYQLPVGGGWQNFPAPPPLAGRGEEYLFFLFVPDRGGAEFRIRNIRIRRTEIARSLTPSRRYGAVGR